MYRMATGMQTAVIDWSATDWRHTGVLFTLTILRCHSLCFLSFISITVLGNRSATQLPDFLKNLSRIFCARLGGRRPHSFSIEFSPKFSPILAKILVIWIFYWIFAKFFTNFGENFGELKNLVSFWVTKMSPILVTIIPPNFVLFLSPILVKISVIWWNWWVFKWRKFHQFWWQ